MELKDFLGALKDQYGDNLEKADKSVGGAWIGDPIPVDREYNIKIVYAEYKPSNAGNYNVVITFEINDEESDFNGRRGREYYPTDTQNEISARKFSELILASGVSLENAGTDWGLFAEQFVGTTYIAALRAWGEDGDQYGIRWINADRGQSPKLKINPPKVSAKVNLRPTISIPKEEPFPDTPQTSSISIPSVSSPGIGGPKLPPGLGR